MTLRGWIAAALLLAGSLRIAGTWQVLTQTYDEGFHIACGLEWWERKQYTHERQHPPLGRIAIGALPHLMGVRDVPGLAPIETGNAILGTGPDYFWRLALARAGTLPFYLMFCISLWLWAKMRGGPDAGLATLFIASQLPPVLGHSGVATVDMAAVATLALALWRFDVWLESSSWRSAAWLGVAAGLCLGSKMTNLALLPLLAGIVWISRRRLPARFLRQLSIAFLIALLVILSLYRFKKEYNWARAEGKRTVVQRVLGLRAFLVPYITGVEEVLEHSRDGHPGYVLGFAYDRGHWLFFPVVFAVKTPIPVMILLLIALRYRAAWWAWIMGAVVLLLLLPSTINLGVRHALAIYIGGSLAAGFALAQLWSRTRWLAVALGAWLTVNVTLAHPDYLAWFNELAGKHPEHYLAESDLDWGQDLHRLIAAMDRRGIQTCNFAYFGTADWQKLAPGRLKDFWWGVGPEPGCYAVSARMVSLEMAWSRAHGRYEDFQWLIPLEPTEEIGRSIRLYVIPPGQTGTLH